MKLIVESVDASFVTEGVGAEQKYFIEGVFLQADVPNKNRRLYPMTILESAVNTYITERVIQHRAYGELGHPSGPTINPERVSHRILSIVRDGNNFIGRASINKNPMGLIARNFLDEGSRLGVSSRGVGTLKERADGLNEVCEDYIIATAADIVMDPSGPDAMVRGIMENVEFYHNGVGGWSTKDADLMKTDIQTMTRTQIREQKTALLEKFLSIAGKTR